MATIGTDILEAKRLLEAGKLIGLPTETVYGLAGNALNESALLEIFKVKNRPKFDPLIAHIATSEMLGNLAERIPHPAKALADAFWPGPLTLLLPKKKHIPDLLTSGLSTVAVRMPSHPLAHELLSTINFPLAAPSANPFGYISPTSAQHVQNQLGDQIPYILDGGTCQIGLESTIVGFTEEEEAIVYRLGGMKLEQLEEVVGPLKIALNKSSNPNAPGMLKSHYAPKTPLFLGNIESLYQKHSDLRLGIISFDDNYRHLKAEKHRALSLNGDLDEAARNLFSALRDMDSSRIDVIIAEKMPETGLGLAINDRLERASVR